MIAEIKNIFGFQDRLMKVFFFLLQQKFCCPNIILSCVAYPESKCYNYEVNNLARSHANAYQI